MSREEMAGKEVREVAGAEEVREHFIATEETEQMEAMGHLAAMARRVATWCCRVQKSNP
jgi:hypothetical protein